MLCCSGPAPRLDPWHERPVLRNSMHLAGLLTAITHHGISVQRDTIRCCALAVNSAGHLSHSVTSRPLSTLGRPAYHWLHDTSFRESKCLKFCVNFALRHYGQFLKAQVGMVSRLMAADSPEDSWTLLPEIAFVLFGFVVVWIALREDATSTKEFRAGGKDLQTSTLLILC